MTQGFPTIGQDKDSVPRAWHIGFNNETWMDLFLSSGSASMGWPQVNKDISKLQSHESVVDATDASESVHPRNPAVQLRKFAHEAEIGDIIVLKDGLRYHSDDEWGGNGNIRAIGVIDGEYTHADARDYYGELPIDATNKMNEHHRSVRWVINFDEQLGGPFTPEIAFSQWTFDELDEYPALREQIISSRGLHGKFTELEEYATSVAQAREEEKKPRSGSKRATTIVRTAKSRGGDLEMHCGVPKHGQTVAARFTTRTRRVLRKTTSLSTSTRISERSPVRR